MRELGSSGVWEIFIPGIGAGETYKFQILNANYTWEMKADPMERQHEVPAEHRLHRHRIHLQVER